MKKLFGIPGSVIKKILPRRKKKKTNLPYSDPRGTEKEKKSSRQGYDPKKTQMGIQADYPSDNQPNEGKQKDIETCPKCQYPLRTKPDSSSPCPNCGYTGNHMKTVFDSGKTISINSLSQESEELQEFKFKLIKEDNNSEIEIQSTDEPEVILNRSHLDANNSTISGEQHVIMKFKNKKIYIEDVSSNGSSFIQAKTKMMIQNGSRLVIGNKIYVFSQSGNLPDSNNSNITRKFGEFDLKVSQTGSGFNLTDETNGKSISFDKAYIILNRANLDPGNNSISSSRHAEFEFNNGQWFVKDFSSNESTFIQLKSEQLLENKIRIILGNKIFRFEYT
jgi:uncharacterized Zn finger protein (UPF0148 family)